MADPINIKMPGNWGGVPYAQGTTFGQPLSPYANLVDQIYASQQPMPVGRQFNRWNFGWPQGGPPIPQGQAGGLLGGQAPASGGLSAPTAGLLSGVPRLNITGTPSVPASTPTPTGTSTGAPSVPVASPGGGGTSPQATTRPPTVQAQPSPAPPAQPNPNIAAANAAPGYLAYGNQTPTQQPGSLMGYALAQGFTPDQLGALGQYAGYQSPSLTYDQILQGYARQMTPEEQAYYSAQWKQPITSTPWDVLFPNATPGMTYYKPK